MRKIIGLTTIAMVASFASAKEGTIKKFNDLGYGTISGRVQYLGMYRDYDNGVNAHSSTLGLQLDYLSPEFAGLSVGGSYVGVGVLDSMDYGTSPYPGDFLVANGRVHVLNEGYVNYNMAALNLTNSTALVGRRANNGEVFRYTEARQKKRSLEGVMIETKDIPNTRLLVGHTWKESNIWSTDSHGSLSSWKFQDFGEVFNTGYDTHGVTWGEVVNKSVDSLELVLFDAYAYDVVNLFGGRARYNFTEKTALELLYRNETEVGKMTDQKSDVFGLSVFQKVGAVKLEVGYFGVYGDTLQFEESRTGINHALGSSLMIYTGQFNGGSDTLYAKAVTKLDNTKTTLYGLFNYTWHDHSKTAYDAWELDLIAKQPITDNLSVAFKGGMGYRDGAYASSRATDARLFLTYGF